MDQSNQCFYTKGDLTKPHLATKSSIFPMSVHLSVLKPHTSAPFFSKGYKFCDCS